MNNMPLRFFYVPRPMYAGEQRARARITLLLGDLFIGVELALMFVALFSPSPTGAFRIFMGGLISLVLSLLSITLCQLGLLPIARALSATYLIALGFASLLLAGVTSNFSLLLLLPVIYVGLTFGVRNMFLVTLLNSLAVLATGYLQLNGLLSSNLPKITSLGIVLSGTIGLMVAISGVLALSLREDRSTRDYANKLVSQLRATAEVAQTTTTMLDLDELLRRTVDFIRDRFAFYHVQIFLIDEDGRYANLVASTGEAGEALLGRGHRLAVGSQSIIGQVTRLGTPVSAQDTSTDAIHRMNELLPQTRSELAMPLIAGDQIIGALDVQSTRSNAYTQDDINSLQIMANQVSITIRNAQLFAAQKKALADNRRLFLDAEANLREIERLNQRLSGEAWADYLRARRVPSLGFTFDDEQLRSDNQWTQTLKQAANKGRPVIKNDGKKQIVAVPIELRGETIGALEVEVLENTRQSDTLDMIQSIAQRLALSIDNARLFEQAQEVAQQELEVNAISSKIQGNSDMEEVLRIVLGELSRVLGAEQSSIRVGIASAGTSREPLEAGSDTRKVGAPDGNGTANGAKGSSSADWIDYSQGRRTQSI